MRLGEGAGCGPRIEGADNSGVPSPLGERDRVRGSCDTGFFLRVDSEAIQGQKAVSVVHAAWIATALKRLAMTWRKDTAGFHIVPIGNTAPMAYSFSETASPGANPSFAAWPPPISSTRETGWTEETISVDSGSVSRAMCLMRQSSPMKTISSGM